MGRRMRVIGGPWPQRIGCEGEVVDPPGGRDARCYPFVKRGRNEVIVLLDNDPLLAELRAIPRGLGWLLSEPPDPTWSCVIDTSHLEFLT